MFFVFAFFLFLHLVVSNFFADRSGSLGFVVLSFGFQESEFSEFKDTTYRTERINEDSVVQHAFRVLFTRPSVNAEHAQLFTFSPTRKW